MQLALRLRGIDRIDGVPGGQIKVRTGGHRRGTFHPAAIAKQRHHSGQRQLLVKISTADMHAAGGENIGVAVSQVASFRGQAHQGEVRGAAADIDDQHQFFPADARLIVKRSGNGFVLE